MSHKAQILAAVRRAKPDLRPLPPLPEVEPTSSASLRSRFTESLLKVGSEWVEESTITNWSNYLQQHYPGNTRIVTTSTELAARAGMEYLSPAQSLGHELAGIEVAIIEGQWAVAENGAIWVPEDALPARVLPFITQHLIVLVSTNKLVATMHDAYARIELGQSGYGVFIAGPSKTADIEQSLVKGAQGARTELVVICPA